MYQKDWKLSPTLVMWCATCLSEPALQSERRDLSPDWESLWLFVFWLVLSLSLSRGLWHQHKLATLVTCNMFRNCHPVKGNYILSHNPSNLFFKTCSKEKGYRWAQFQGKWVTEYIFVEHRGFPICLYAWIKLQCTDSITSDIITQLDMLKTVQNTREMSKRTGSPTLKRVYWGNKIFF